MAYLMAQRFSKPPASGIAGKGDPIFITTNGRKRRLDLDIEAIIRTLIEERPSICNGSSMRIKANNLTETAYFLTSSV